MKSKILCFCFAFVCVYIMFNRRTVDRNILYAYDKSGYYIYLPATFIYHDLKHFSFQPDVASWYSIGGGQWYGLYELTNGNRINKYTIGVSIFELPLFLVAHAYCKILKGDNPDGYSNAYEYSLIFSTILWSFLGLLVLRRFLLRHFSDNITSIVIVCIGFGTNFYCYAAFDHGMSHNFSFFLFSCLLLSTDRWYANGIARDVFLLGVVLGLIIIVRPVNAIACILPVMWGLYNKETLLARLKFLIQNIKSICIAVLLFFAVVFIQLYYWKVVTGHWVHYSYAGEGFDFKNPEILKGLFSFRKGWFIYTPIAFLAFLGLFLTKKKFLPTYISFFALIIYVVFSWENWYYGGGFGCRPLIETLPLLSLPLAFLTQIMYYKATVFIKIFFSAILIATVSLNIFQTYQYSSNVIHYDKMTCEYYRRVFLKTIATDDDRRYLMSDDEYVREMESWHKN